MSESPADIHFDMTIIAPAHNEAENVDQLIREIGEARATLAAAPHGLQVDAIIVNDGSTDDTEARLLALAKDDRPWLKVLNMTNTPPGRGNGQSAAFKAAFLAARGEFIASLDADLQNPPDNLPTMWALLKKENADVVQGDRTDARREGIRRWISTWFGRQFRRFVLGDTIRDTGCSLRIIRREAAIRLPLEFQGMHRYIPGTVRRMGYKVVETPVTFRQREAGVSKYGLFNRMLPGMFDILAVRWMHNRRKPTDAQER